MALFCQTAEFGKIGEIVALEEFVHGILVTKAAQLSDLAEGKIGGDGVFFYLFKFWLRTSSSSLMQSNF